MTVRAQMPVYPYLAPSTTDKEQAKTYCATLAKRHYENFVVASLLIPRKLRQHFYNVYAYCRIADDLGDEAVGAEEALGHLSRWESELRAAYAGSPNHPVFVALSETNRQFDIPIDPYLDLLIAFRQDQTVKRYETYDQLLGYCRYSANPVGRLVLMLAGYRDEEQFKLSDTICTSLQLANFWQDVVRDYEIGRIYLPLEDLNKFNVPEDQIRERRFTAEFRRLMAFECNRTEMLFREGEALYRMVGKPICWDIELFGKGGMEVIRRIRRQNYDVLASRPSVPKSFQLKLLAARILKGMFIR